MRLIAALTEKSWENPGLPDPDAPSTERPLGGWDKGVGLGVFLAVVTILFTLLTAAYLMRRGLHDSAGNSPEDWFGIALLPIIWVNTGVLVASSLAFSFALRSARRGDAALLRWGVLAGGLLGFLFLAGQILMWQQLEASGFGYAMKVFVCSTGDPLSLASVKLVTGNVAIAFFYLICALHGLHILGGLAAWSVTGVRILDGAGPTAVERSVQLCARYWHYLLGVWVAMLTLFVVT